MVCCHLHDFAFPAQQPQKSPRCVWLWFFFFAFLAWQDKSYAYWQGQNGGQKLVETPYNSIRIMEGKDYRRNGEAVRLIATDPGYTQSGMLINDPQKLYFDYTRFYALGPAHSPEAQNILMLGGGGYSVPKWLLSGKSALPIPGR